MLDLLSEDDIDFVVLARYVQILTRGFIDACGLNLIINIHHSFLPAFVGLAPTAVPTAGASRPQGYRLLRNRRPRHRSYSQPGHLPRHPP